jgi:hypothetical protein
MRHFTLRGLRERVNDAFAVMKYEVQAAQKSYIQARQEAYSHKFGQNYANHACLCCGKKDCLI